MMKFKVGDIVIGNEKANGYPITKQGWKGVVTKVREEMFDAWSIEESCEFHLLNCDYFDLKEPQQFTKADLKSGDVVIKRRGNIEIVCLETGTLINKESYNLLSFVKDDLTNEYGKDYDIVKVYRPKEPYQCSFNGYAAGKLMFG